MGERILRPGIRTSDGMAKAIRGAGMQAGYTFTLLLTVVDDYGRYDGRAAILRSELFPLLGDMVRESDLERWLQALQLAGLIRLYALDGKRYLEVQNFRQRMRAAKSKWPAPSADEATSTEKPVSVMPPHADTGNRHDTVVTMPSDTDTETDTEKIPVSTKPAAAAGDEGGGGKTPGGRRGRKLSDAEQATRNAFTIWFQNHAWPNRNGGEEYPFDGPRDGPAVIKLLKFVKWDIDRARRIAEVYLDTPEMLMGSALSGRPIWGIANNLSRWTVAAKKRHEGKPYANQPGRPSAGNPGRLTSGRQPTTLNT